VSRILLRFNTKFTEDPKRRTWRVLVDGKEKLAEKVFVNAAGETIQEDVDGVPKYHVMFNGHVSWEGDLATISKTQSFENDEISESLMNEINSE
jgi:hypothetical protein